MLFNSYKFLFAFLPITMLGFHLLGRFGRRPVIAWLGLASLVFYSAFNPIFVLFLLASILINYAVASALSRTAEDRRRKLLYLGVTLNLVALFYFKYLYHLLLVLPLHLQPHPIALPLGISFFTFTQISYLIDLAQGQVAGSQPASPDGVKTERQDLLSYLLFVTFFPHLIAGPILHHKEMMPPFADPSARGPQRFALKPNDVALGLTWFLMGLAKKVLLADNLSATADAAFAHPATLSAASAWTGLIVYSMQLYFDFSGYSDMALGLARIFSIRFPLNFDSPFKATSITEYWQRWHMTLTRYITLYLYNPLLLAVQRYRLRTGRKISRKALATPSGFLAMVAYPTLLTMLLTGLWHGAGLQFLLFGLIHGVYLTANQAWRHFRPSRSNPTGPRRLLMMLGVYLQVIFALIFFRSASLSAAFDLLQSMSFAHGAGTLGALLEGSLAFALFPVVWFLPNTQQILGQEANAPALLETPTILSDPAPTLFSSLRWAPDLRWAVAMAVLFFAVLVELNPHSTFLYFQF